MDLAQALRELGRRRVWLALGLVVAAAVAVLTGYHVKAGHIFLEQGDLDRAMDHMQRASAANPDDPAIQMGMFEVHAAAGNLEEGKKIHWRDAFVVMATLIRCRFLP